MNMHDIKAIGHKRANAHKSTGYILIISDNYVEEYY